MHPNARLIPAVPDEISLHILKHAFDSADGGSSTRWNVQPSRRDFDPSRKSRSWLDEWKHQREVWARVGAINRSWRAECRRYCIDKTAFGRWRLYNGTREERWDQALDGVRFWAISCESICPYEAERRIASLAHPSLLHLTNVVFHAPSDLACIVPLLSATPNLRSLGIFLSTMDCPARRFCHGVPLPRTELVYALESFELVVDACSVPATADLLALIGPKSATSLKRLALSFKDVHGSLYSKLSFNTTIVSLLSQHTESLVEVIIDDWDQATSVGLLEGRSELPQLPSLERLVLGGAGLDAQRLRQVACPRLKVLEIDDVRGAFKGEDNSLPDALEALWQRRIGSGLQRLYCAGDSLDLQRQELQRWTQGKRVGLEWSEGLQALSAAGRNEN